MGYLQEISLTCFQDYRQNLFARVSLRIDETKPFSHSYKFRGRTKLAKYLSELVNAD